MEPDRSPEGDHHEDYGLLMLPITLSGDVTDSDDVSHSSKQASPSAGARMDLACVDLELLSTDALSESKISNTAARLANIHARSNLAGIALQCSSIREPHRLNDLLERLYMKSVPVLLLCGHDSETWASVSFSYIAGVIVENACILLNGQRRDYFRSRSLRQIMAHASEQRQERPEFFVGFLDLWVNRPHPAVIRRAVKLAEHFGAIIEHGPANPSVELANTVKSAAQTLSGFEYLRRTAVIEVSKFNQILCIQCLISFIASKILDL